MSDDRVADAWVQEAAKDWERRKAEEQAQTEAERKRADSERQRLEADERRVADDARKLEDERRRLDEEHARRVAERKRIEAEREALESQRRQLEADQVELDEMAAQRQRLDDAAALRKQERLKLDEESRRIESERAALEAAEQRERDERKSLDQKETQKDLDADRVAKQRAKMAEIKRRADEDKAKRDEEQRRAVDEVEKHNFDRAAAESPEAEAAAKLGTRRRARVHLQASVLLKGSGGKHIVLPVRDMSLSGLFLSAEGHDLSSLPVGTPLEFMLFASDDVKNEVDVKAKVVRQAPDGIAIDWSEDLTATYKIALLMETLPARGG